MADVNGGMTGGGGRETLASVRDRLFHTLFYRVSLGYARTFNPTTRRLLETVILLKAILCFLLLVYIHLAFARRPIQCLEHIKESWPRDGILRVEIMKDPPENYGLKESYEKERKIQQAHRHNEEMSLFVFFPPEGYEFEDTGHSIDSVDDQSLASPEVNEDHSEGDWIEVSSSGPDNPLQAFEDEQSVVDIGVDVSTSNSSSTLVEVEDSVTAEKDSSLSKNYISSVDEYMVEYSLEYGFLRLSPSTRQRLNISVQLVVLDPSKGDCFGDFMSQFMLQNFLGYDDVLMASIKSLAEHEDNKGFLRNVVTGSHYHFVSKTTSSASYISAALVMMIFTVSITMLLRYSQHQIFIFIVELLQMLEFNTPITIPAAPLLTVILALVGMEAIMSEFFEDTSTAFYIILIVWIADQYDAICCHTSITKRFWLRFFYLYHFSFYAYHYRFSGQYSGLALLTMWFFTQHSMLYFFHHYELQVILQQAQLQDLLFRNQIDGGAPTIRLEQRLNNNNSNIANRNSTGNVAGVPAVQGVRRMAAFNFAGFRFRLGIVLTTASPQSQNRPQPPERAPESQVQVETSRAEDNRSTSHENSPRENLSPTDAEESPGGNNYLQINPDSEGAAAPEAQEEPPAATISAGATSGGDGGSEADLAAVADELRQVSAELKSLTRRRRHSGSSNDD